ncbi:hypothetical protein TIFTF001_046712 [Ficus carica]|uniref:Uncharacterized protein n=1 Tax=Ficus carica TaxID=3494 RepID=A0AA88CXE7_FICCA|nr:hypothetical protein TIFTF001_046712 [Ficus carica]
MASEMYMRARKCSGNDTARSECATEDGVLEPKELPLCRDEPAAAPGLDVVAFLALVCRQRQGLRWVGSGSRPWCTVGQWWFLEIWVGFAHGGCVWWLVGQWWFKDLGLVPLLLEFV